MTSAFEPGSGLKLRRLLNLVEGDLIEMYKTQGHAFRPGFSPIFKLLLPDEKLSMSQIAAQLQISQSGVTRALGEMKRAGFVAYEQGRDKREKLVMLTPSALALAADLKPIWDASDAAMLRLEGELSFSLSDILDEALSALSKRSYADRMSDHLSGEVEYMQSPRWR